MQTTTATDRATVKTDDARLVRCYLTEEQWRELRRRMADDGQTSTSRFLVRALALDTPSNK